MTSLTDWIVRTRPGTATAALIVRLAAGCTFLGFSLGKFIRHDAERGAFERYGIPFPDTATYLIGGLELIGGAALVVGLMVRPFALALACNMTGAITTAGRIDGGPVHLLLAPALLAGMLFLVWAGPGAASVDGLLATGRGLAPRARGSG